ncbi:SPFH domain-containing protein [Glaciecola sp. MF2-115]|uniref:flotillin family protein n=1 Tax=Glaciecola sp. MF2-115 TaxID=3384827 RepID=UPI0039A31F18
MSETLIFWASVSVAVVVTFLAIVFMLARLYKKVEQGRAMIVNTMRSEPKVTFTGGVVLPVFHKLEVMDISLKTIEVDRSGTDGLICKDNIRADIKVAFFVKVNKNRDDVLKVAQAIGCERASNIATLEDLFSAKFSEALKTVGKSLEFEDLYAKRDNFRDMIIDNIGTDLNGYVLEDVAIDYLEQTPIEKLDPNNILDSQGIRKITQLTADQHIQTNVFQRDEEMKIKRKDVETREAILELERQEADAVAKQEREVATVRSREKAETERVQHEEHLKAEQARVLAEQEIQVQEQNKQREIEVAENNRLRAIGIEEERVIRARELEQIDREKEASLQRIANEKLIEHEKREIAEVIRSRIEVDKTVAEREEEINELRVVSEADRNKKSRVIQAEAEAEEALVKDIKAAEAAEKSAEYLAKEKSITATADLEVAEKRAQSQRQDAAGREALSAADGLAEAKVMEAQALAKEKEGMADVRVKEAMADAIEKSGVAEAEVLAKKAEAEAEGMTKKFAAMATMSPEQKAHEEFRMRLDKQHEQIIKSIDTNVDIAQQQAIVLAEALKQANIDIVGGDTAYFDSFVKSLSVGKSIDGTIGKSETLGTAFAPHFKGDASFVEDAKELVAGFGGASGNAKDTAVTALIAKFLKESGDNPQVMEMVMNALNKKTSGEGEQSPS